MVFCLFDSDMTYAVGKESSTSSQILIKDINIVLNIFLGKGKTISY